MVSHDAPKSFTAVARFLQQHIKEAEDRCSAFEHQCNAPEFLAVTKGEHRAAAARWWWREVNKFFCYSHITYVEAFTAITSLLDAGCCQDAQIFKFEKANAHEMYRGSLQRASAVDFTRLVDIRVLTRQTINRDMSRST